MFRRMSFKVKLLTLCLFMAVVSVTVGVSAYVGLHRVEDSYDRVAQRALPKIRLSGEMYSQYRQVRISLRTLGLPGLTKEAQEEAVRDTLQAIERYESAEKEYSAFDALPGEEELHQKVESQWSIFKAIGTKALKLHADGTQEARAELMKIFVDDCPKAASAYSAAIAALVEFQKASADQHVVEAKLIGDETTLNTIYIAAIGVFVGLLFGIVMATKLSNSIGKIVASLAETARQVAAASTQIASSSEELSQATTEQAASLEETAASIEEMSSMISMTSDNAKNTAQTSSDSLAQAEDGKRVVEKMISSMDEINASNSQIMAQVERSNDQMSEIIKVIEEIGNKTRVINDIVFQTKLLSFNASVEAARAGEHGKGFAVVAEEVGNLATMSGNAAKEISSMLDSSIRKVENIVHESKSKVEGLVAGGKQKVEAGTQVARQCGEVLGTIVTNVGEVSKMAGEISTASQEQSQGVRELTKAMAQLDNVTQQNASTSEGTASAAEQLARQAEVLRLSVDELAAAVHGSGHSAKLKKPKKTEAPLSQESVDNKVVQMKPAPSSSLPRTEKRAVGGVPPRSHQGFNDV